MLVSTFWRGLALACLLAPVVACGDEGAPNNDDDTIDDTIDDPDAAIGDPDAAIGDPDGMPLEVDAPVVADADGCDGDGNTFMWSLVAGASYQLEYTPVGGAATVVDLPAGLSSYQPDVLLPIGATPWRIRALIDTTYSAYAEATLTVQALPATPTTLARPDRRPLPS